MKSLIESAIARLRRGDIRNTAYLTYYYTYLMLYDCFHGTRFAVSHKPAEVGSEPMAGATGNFPIHPRLVRLYLSNSGLDKNAPVIDVGHGSGTMLYVAARMGYTNLTGVEYGRLPYELSTYNLAGKATLLHDNAFNIDLSRFEAIFFFNPFRGECAEQFMSRVPTNISTIITINHDSIINDILFKKGFMKIFSYRNLIYKNFDGIIFKRNLK